MSMILWEAEAKFLWNQAKIPNLYHPLLAWRFDLSTKKYSHNLKVESYFTWWECLQL